MPKKSSYLLAWSPAQQAYVLSEGSGIAQPGIEPETPAWFAWLDHVASFAFAGQSGSATLRKESIHGEVYWYAYRRTGEKLTKKYVGKAAAVTIARLEQMAGLLEAVQAFGESLLFDLPSTLSFEAASEPQATVRPEKSMARPPADAVQRDPLLFTKLHVARPRAQLVPRPHLVERLQQASTSTLTLVSAPAGFGKTTLLAQWLAEQRMPVAWLSLEPEDNDPVRFLSYLIAALQTVETDVGTSASALLHSPQPPPLETVLAMLTNDLTSHLAGDVALVLDDYHVITAAPLHHAMHFLVDHCPPQLHLVLASRADPPLPLARLRARGQLTELRAAQLQFAEDETRLFLQQAMGLDLSSEEVATLQSRTEGWIAGLHLAALSLQGRADVQQFLADFTGSHRHLIDYLVEDVLAYQSADVQSFLLHTCILERLCGSLCEAVTDEPAGQVMLERIEAAHLFLTPLDDRRQWYRYHHLFAEVLRHRLRHEEPALVPLLHRRASQWYEQQGFIREAVQHALDAHDFELAARQLEQTATDLLARRGEISTLYGWFDLLPPALIRSHLSLCLWYGWSLATRGRYAEAASMLEAIEHLQATASPAERGRIVTPAGVNHLTDSEVRGEIAGLGAYLAFRHADLPRTILLGREALEQLSQFSPSCGFVAWTLGKAYGASGEVQAASQIQAELRRISLAEGNVYTAILATFELASLQLMLGRLHAAEQLYREALQLTDEQAASLPATGPALVGLGGLEYEWNHLEAAAELLRPGVLHARQTDEASVILQGVTALAWVKQAQGDEAGARALLEQALQVVQSHHLLAQPRAYVLASQARLALRQGDVAAAVRWAEACGLNAEHGEDERDAQRAMDYLTLARVYLAQRRLSEAATVLDRLLPVAQAQGYLGSVMEILLLQALTQHAQGETPRALTTLQRALALAEPEGYMRLFVDEGPPMAELLHMLLAHEQAKSGTDYIRKLLAVLEAAHPRQMPAALSTQTAQAPLLLDPLSPRERKVLRLLAAGLSNPEIANELVVSLNTVKTQVSSLYRKLNVTNRKEAIAAARSWNLL